MGELCSKIKYQPENAHRTRVDDALYTLSCRAVQMSFELAMFDKLVADDVIFDLFPRHEQIFSSRDFIGPLWS